jgi:hypothetical protein
LGPGPSVTENICTCVLIVVISSVLVPVHIQQTPVLHLVELWIPGKKFTKSGVITYEDNSIQVKKIDYHVVLYAYSNYSTAQDIGP